MRSIHHNISSFFNKSVILQLTFAILTLVITLFGTISYQAYQYHQHFKEDFATIYGQLAYEKSNYLYQKLNLLGVLSLNLATQTGEILSSHNRYDSPTPLIREGEITHNKLANGGYTLYSPNELTQNFRQKAAKVSQLLPLLESSTKNSNEIDSGWIKIDEPITLIYPPRSEPNPAVFDPLNDPMFNMFLNNPRKQWRVTITGNNRITITAPIFVDSTLAGVAGFDLNLDQFNQTLNNLTLPNGTAIVLVDTEQNRIIAGNNNQIDIAKIVAGNSSDRLTYRSDIGSLPLVMIVTIKKSDLETVGLERFKVVLSISILALIFVLIFYVVFMRRSKREIEALAHKFSKPLDEIVRFSHHLGLQNNRRLEPTGIADLDDLSNHLHLAHSRLVSLLIVDELTGIYNRRKLILDLEKNEHFGLITMNINRFKYINDTYGYSAGDYVLKRMVELLKDIECETCEIYRIAGDEFALLVPTDKIEHLQIYADNIVSAVGNSLFLFKEIEMEVSISVGVALSDGRDCSKLLYKADVALSRSREVRQLPVMIYSSDLEADKQYESSLYWEKRVKDSIRTGNMIPWFQPIMQVEGGRINKFEALVRIVEGGEVIPPYFFLGVAQKMGFMYEIAKRVITKTFEAASRYKTVEFSINLSLSDLEHPKLLEFITETKEHFGIPSDLITFEMLETEALSLEGSQVRNTVKKLKEMGFKIAIDDFGSGYSNFARFLDLEVDYIKIDGQFIRNLHRDENSQHALKAILDFASTTNAKTVAEYVETKHIYQAIAQFPIDYIQGFFVSKPVPEEEIERLLRS